MQYYLQKNCHVGGWVMMNEELIMNGLTYTSYITLLDKPKDKNFER